jgi:probable HAF family extracellular repeat protein
MAALLCIGVTSAADADYVFTTLTLEGLPLSSVYGAQAYGINNRGDIVGTYVDSNNVQHGYLYSNGSYTTLNAPGGAPPYNTQAFGINERGQIAGEFFRTGSKAATSALTFTTTAPSPTSALPSGAIPIMHLGSITPAKSSGYILVHPKASFSITVLTQVSPFSCRATIK